MIEFETDKSYYQSVWYLIFSRLACWPDKKIYEWISKWDTEFEFDEVPSVMYHETPQMYAAYSLIPLDLGAKLSHKEQIILAGDIGFALDGSQPVKLGPDSDWDMYRERVNAILQKYGESLPNKSDAV